MKRRNIRLARNSALICLCLAINAIEALFLKLIPLPIPGAKIGLSNLVILFCIGNRQYGLSWCLALTRPFVSALLFGNPVGFLFSVCGGILSVFVMQLSSFLTKYGFTFLSLGIAGSVAFQFGQSIAALVLYGSSVLYYTPILLFFGSISGALIGLMQNLLFPRLAKIFTLHE